MIVYRVITQSTCMTEAELDIQWTEGYELVSVAGVPTTAVGIGGSFPLEYCHYFKYAGGVRGSRSVSIGM